PSGTTATFAGIVVHDNGVSGTLTFGSGNAASTLTITGDIVVNTNGTLRSGGTGNNHILYLRGNITNNNVVDFTIGGSNHYFSFEGSTSNQNQVISGTGNTFAFERIVMNT